jgi:hypothetical protein
MGADESEHMKIIHRWLAGEVVNNHVGIKVVGGPFEGRTKIVRLDQSLRPPLRLRASGGPAGPTKHVYEAIPSTAATAGWHYSYVGPDPTINDPGEPRT